MTLPGRADVNNNAPVFIIGSGRSGTTLMRYMLNAHPAIYIAEEICYHFWMTRLRGNFRQKLHHYFDTFSFRWLRLPTGNILETLPTNAGDSCFADTYRQILQQKSGRYQRRRWGEKGPLLIESLDRIFADFPDARVIHVLRDPRSIVHSHTTMPWSTASLLAANVVVRNNLARIAHFGERILTVQLENLVTRPETTMRSVLAFIGEDWDPRVLQHASHRLPDDGIPFPWLQEASGNRRQKRLLWSDAMSPAWIRITESLQRKTLQDFGYATQALPTEPSAIAKMQAVIGDFPALLYSAWRLCRLVALFVMLRKNETEAFQTLLHSLNPDAWLQHPDWPAQLPPPPAPTFDTAR